MRAKFVEERLGPHASYPVAGGCSCMLLLDLVLTSADAGPDLCTLCPDLCTLHPDLCTLRLWCFPSVNWCNRSTCTHATVVHPLQLVLLVLFIRPLLQILHLHSDNLHCMVAMVVCVVVCSYV